MAAAMEVRTRSGAVLRRSAPIATGVAVLAAGAYVAINDPASAGSTYVGCPLREMTGLWCPGCGLTRGAHHLLHGDVAAALSSNVFTPIALGMIVLAWWTWTRHAFGTSPRARPGLLARVPLLGWVALAATVLLYGVLRNVPAAPFRALAP